MAEEQAPTMQAIPSGDVFISYASQDAATANATVEALEKHGVRCWIAPRDVRAGAQYADAIVRAISSAKAIVLVLSEHAIASSHVGREVERAASKHRRIIALRVDAAPLTPALEYFLSESQWIEVKDGKMQVAYARLIEAIREPEGTKPSGLPGTTPGTSSAKIPTAQPLIHRNKVLLGAGLAVLALILAGLWAGRSWFVTRAPRGGEAPTSAAVATVPEKSIAVLPFIDMSEKHDQEYFSDGLSEELIDMLTKVPDLKVPARTSSFYFKGKQTTIKDIAAALGVAHVLEGSVRKSGTQLRITAQLIRAADGFHFWSHTYDRKLDDIFKLQDEIAGAVVTALKSSLADGTGLRLSTTHNSEAFAHYLQARDISRQMWTSAGMEQIVGHLRTAVRLDPGFVVGWASLAGALESKVNFDERHGDTKLLTEMRAANERALALGPQVGLVQYVNADIQSTIDWDWDGAALSMRKAYEADSTDPDNCAGLATALFTLGRDDATSIDLLKKAIALDPLDSNNYVSLGDEYLVLGKLSEAEDALREALRLDPSGLDPNNELGNVLIAEGKTNEALAIYQSKLPPGMRLRGMAIAYFELGRNGDAKAALDELVKNYATRFAYSIARIHARRQGIDEAFNWLERAYVLHDSALRNVNRDPWLRNLHRDNRWSAFLKKMNLPEIPGR